MRFYCYAVPTALLLLTGVIGSRWHTEKEQYHIVQNHVLEETIARQCENVRGVLFRDESIRWASTKFYQTEEVGAGMVIEGWNPQDKIRVTLMFDQEERIRSITLPTTYGQGEGGMLTAKQAQTVAGNWLNRFPTVSGLPWKPTEPCKITSEMGYSWWRSGDNEAFIGIERNSGLPAIIRFKYPGGARLSGSFRKSVPSI